MSAESVKKARERYIKDKTKIMAVRFNKESDKDIIAYLDDHPNKIETIRKALRLLMESEG